MTLFDAFDISASGLTTQAERLKIYANNVANANTPYYVRKIPVVHEEDMMNFSNLISRLQNGVIMTGIRNSPGGVALTDIVQDPTPGKQLYQPGHPDAINGYITLSNVNPMADMADAMSASRLYEANIAVIGVVKNMENRALEIGRSQ